MAKTAAKKPNHAKTHAAKKPVITWPSKDKLTSELALGALFAELFGTFILTVALLATGSPFGAPNAIIATLTVLILVMVLSRLSGGHINPAVTIGLWATRQISGLRAIGYLIAQLLGAMLALVVVTQFINSDPAATQESATQVFKAAALNGDWRPFFAEMLGTALLGFGVAAAVIGRKNSHEAGFIIGGSLFLGLVMATLGSVAILNPAVALGMSAYDLANWWTVLVYAGGPILGAVAGAWIYKLLQNDIENVKSES